MPLVPTWQAPTSGQPALAGHVNQLLGTHAITYVQTGALASHQSTAGTGTVQSNGLWTAQSFSTAAGQTATGYVVVTIGSSGAPEPWTVSLQADSAGKPSGTPLVSALVPHEFAPGSGFATPVMLPAAGLTASAAYWVVAQAQGTVTDYFAWDRSDQPSGASTSPDGVTWTAQAYGLLYEVWDGTAVAPLAGTYEDNGARWTALEYNASGQLIDLYEFTAGQTAGGYTAGLRGLVYTSGLLTGVA